MKEAIQTLPFPVKGVRSTDCQHCQKMKKASGNLQLHISPSLSVKQQNMAHSRSLQ
jgi:hypothetical protein